MSESIDVNKIKGFDRLSDKAKKLFLSTYKSHRKMTTHYGQAIKVTEERKRLKIEFDRGDCFYYYPDGTWG